MVNLDKQMSKTLGDLDATYRFAHVAPEMKVVNNVAEVVSPGFIRCEIFDLPTGEMYHSATGESEIEALKKAIAGAIDAPKPKTKAQKMVAAAIQPVEAENAELKRQVAELQSQMAELLGRPEARRPDQKPALDAV